MRSSKSRSRNNKNRSSLRPTGGNIINRVFESSGPDGKVRGTPQQIIEKYNQLHRDAQLSNDRVNAENFSQHAEHYTRMLAEAMREVDRAREEQEQFNRDRQAERDRERNDRLKAQEQVSNAAGQGDQPQPIQSQPPQSQPQPSQPQHPRPVQYQPRPADVVDIVAEDDADNGLVETPETRHAHPLGDMPMLSQPSVSPEASKPRKPRARRPAKPKSPDASAASGPSEAAE